AARVRTAVLAMVERRCRTRRCVVSSRSPRADRLPVSGRSTTAAEQEDRGADHAHPLRVRLVDQLYIPARKVLLRAGYIPTQVVAPFEDESSSAPVRG